MDLHDVIRNCLIALGAILLLNLTALAQDYNSSPSSTMNIPKPPETKQQPVADDYFGQKVVDPYRWLEDGSSTETQRWVSGQLAYTRSILDKLPSREKLHERLEHLLEIGNLGETQVGGDDYYHTRRDGKQNQPVLYLRTGVNGKDEVLVDANQLSKDGTTALDWWHVSHDGKYVAYGTSESGSEMSTLRVMETATRKLLPDVIERTRAASIAWKPDDSGFYYTRYPKKGDVAEGQEMYNRHVFYHALGNDPAKDPLIFGEGRDPQDWPSIVLSNDGRWLAIMVEQGWSKNEVYLKDVQKNTAVVPVTSGKNFLYFVQAYNGDLYILTNEDGPHYRVFKTPVTTPAREHWHEIIPQADAVLTSVDIVGGQLFAPLREERAFRTEALHHRWQASGRNRATDPGHNYGHRWRVRQRQRVLPVQLVHYADDHLPLRHPVSEELIVGFGTDRIRREQVRDQAGMVCVEGRHSRADVSGHAQGAEANRTQPGSADGLRRLQCEPHAGVQQDHLSLARSRRYLRDGQPARWFRVRRRLASRGHARQEAKRVRRLHRRGQVSAERRLH